MVEKVIHQSSKLKSNKIKWNASERVGMRNDEKKKKACMYELLLPLFTIFGMHLRVWLHIFFKIYLNKAEICLITYRQLQCHTDTGADCLDSLRNKGEKRYF